MREVRPIIRCSAAGAVFTCALFLACGGQSLNSTGNAAAGEAASASRTTGGGGQVGSETAPPLACPTVPPSELPTNPDRPPSSFACAEFYNGAWLEMPCGCELWLRSPVSAPLQTSMALAYTPMTSPPSLSHAPDVELEFPDPDASWYAVWANQIGAGSRFTLAHDGSITRVRLGVAELTLDPVTLPGCARLSATARISGPWGTVLDLTMNATFTDGSGRAVFASSGECEQPAEHPTIAWGAGGTGDGGAPQ